MQDFLFYLQLGWEHIISKDALDHQLFILALIAIFSFRDWKKVLILVTAFTIGHSLTLIVRIHTKSRIPLCHGKKVVAIFWKKFITASSS